MASRQPWQQPSYEIIDFSRALQVVVDITAGWVHHVLLALERHRVEVELLEPPRQRRATFGQVIDEIFQGGGLGGRVWIVAPNKPDMDRLEADDQIALLDVLGTQLSAPMYVRLQPNAGQRLPRAPADRLALDHVGACRRNPRFGREVVDDGAAHDRARRVAGANEHDVQGVHGQYLARVDLAALSDRLEIDDLITRYATAVDGRDWDLFRTCFVADASIDYTTAGGTSGTVDDVSAWLEQTLTAFAISFHYVTNREVIVDGDNASGWLAYFNPNTLADGSVLMSGGHYRDRYVRTPDGWKFASRATEGNWLKHVP